MVLEYSPNKVTVTVGNVVDVDYKEMYHDDANIYEISEVSNTPGWLVLLDFDKFRVHSDFVNFFKLDILGWYDGNLGHNIKIYIYNWITEAWVAVTSNAKDILDGSEERSYTFLWETASGMIEKFNGRVRIKIEHTSAGNINHLMYINQLKLSGIILGNIDGAGQY